jgi:hypothetical protein
MDLVGLLFLVLIVGSIVLFVRQVRFSYAAQRLARVIASEDGFDRSSLERDARGKVVPEVAAERLKVCQAAADAVPDDWRAQFQLGVAYGDMRNPQAARAAVRRAVALARAEEKAGS